MKRKVVAVIPARGGSTRIPHKNIVDFRGKPMIVWTLEAARDSGLFDRILVSTDSPDIAAVAASCGFEVPFLRDEFADHHSPVSLATIRALDQLEERLDETYDDVVQLFACCPLRGSEDIVAAYREYERNRPSFLISAFQPRGVNPWWSTLVDAAGKPTRLFPDASAKRSQDLEPLYIPSGAIWIGECKRLRQAGTFYEANHRYYPVSWRAAVDIDDPEDLAWAEAAAASAAVLSLSDEARVKV